MTKEIYAKAKKAHVAGLAILDQIDAGEIPDDQLDAKQQEAQKHFDDTERLTDRAKMRAQSDAYLKVFEDPVNNLPLPDPTKANGFLMSEETKKLAWKLGAGKRVADLDDEMAKDYLASVLYMKGDPKLLSEYKDLATAPGASGGVLVAPTVLNRFVELVENINVMRQISDVLPPIPGGSSVFPSEESELSDAEWTTEVLTGSDDTVAPFGGRQLTPHPLAKRIKASRTLLRAATLVNVEDFILSRLARKFNDAEENAFINGTGAAQPLGLLTATGITSVSTGTSNLVDGDDIINWAYDLADQYAQRASARILTNRAFIRKTRLLKDTTNQYIWQPGLQLGSPSTILDWPYVTSEQYPSGLTADAYDDNALIATIGDFTMYWIQDSLSFEVQRLDELYAETNQVGYIGRKETDAMPVDSAAFRHLKVLA